MRSSFIIPHIILLYKTSVFVVYANFDFVHFLPFYLNRVLSPVVMHNCVPIWFFRFLEWNSTEKELIQLKRRWGTLDSTLQRRRINNNIRKEEKIA